MPWKVTQSTTERFQLIADYQTQLYSVTELYLRYQISRKTAYKWISRCHADGLDGLQERSRVPHSCPHQTSDASIAVVRAAREAHSTWGPRKRLVRHCPELDVVLARSQHHCGQPGPRTAACQASAAAPLAASRRRAAAARSTE